MLSNRERPIDRVSHKPVQPLGCIFHTYLFLIFCNTSHATALPCGFSSPMRVRLGQGRPHSLFRLGLTGERIRPVPAPPFHRLAAMGRVRLYIVRRTDDLKPEPDTKPIWTMVVTRKCMIFLTPIQIEILVSPPAGVALVPDLSFGMLGTFGTFGAWPLWNLEVLPGVRKMTHGPSDTASRKSGAIGWHAKEGQRTACSYSCRPVAACRL